MGYVEGEASLNGLLDQQVADEAFDAHLGGSFGKIGGQAEQSAQRDSYSLWSSLSLWPTR